jgi:hypothetical protein
MILHIKIEEAESIVTLPGVIGNVEVITVHFINLGILSWDSTRSISRNQIRRYAEVCKLRTLRILQTMSWAEFS